MVSLNALTATPLVNSPRIGFGFWRKCDYGRRLKQASTAKKSNRTLNTAYK
jgi:hypothetical protein